MKKADNAESLLFSNRLENLSALLKNGALNNMSNVDQLYEYILWYFSGLMPVQFKVIAGYINFLWKINTAVRNTWRFLWLFNFVLRALVVIKDKAIEL